MTQLAEKRCIPCRLASEPLRGEEIQKRIRRLQTGWTLVGQHHLQREFTFQDFRQALDFVNQVGELAERENHHPDILLTYGKTVIHVWTHKINGLHENDFILAAGIDALRPSDDAPADGVGQTT